MFDTIIDLTPNKLYIISVTIYVFRDYQCTWGFGGFKVQASPIIVTWYQFTAQTQLQETNWDVNQHKLFLHIIEGIQLSM